MKDSDKIERNTQKEAKVVAATACKQFQEAEKESQKAEKSHVMY